MIKLQPFKVEDYETVKAWWESYGIHPLDISILPATSACAWHTNEDGIETMVAAAWVYLDNSVGFSCLAWPVTDPDARSLVKFKAINQITDFLAKHVSEDLGYGLMLTFSSVESISSLMERKGFQTFDRDVTFLAKGIKCHH